MVSIIVGSTKKPISSNRLQDYFQKRYDLNGVMYIGYPIIGTSEGAYPIDAIWLSEEKGLVIFCLVEGKNLENYETEQDDSCNKVEARLRSHRELMDKRRLMISINVTTFAPAAVSVESSEDYPICDEQTLDEVIDSIPEWENPEYYERMVAVIQSVSTIRKNRKKREIVNSESRGAKLQRIEDSIANLDNAQGKAVIQSVEGVQRIRGLAGSGKTIVLALKAAYLHAQHPEWRIAVTFNTRSLKDQLQRWITSFYAEQTNDEPDWEKLRIVHAWGAKSTNGGIYYDFCVNQGVEWLDYAQARGQARTLPPFALVCQKALDEAKDIQPMYDAILVDEAQDFPVEFLRLCYDILDAPKRLVYAYDELQSLNLQMLPSPEEIFGNDTNGNPKVRFEYDSNGQSNQDLILEKCYRNSRQALIIAHALGFGLYRKATAFSDTGIVQMFDQHQLWEDIGYKVVSGELRDGQRVVLERTSESSPTFLENHSPSSDLCLCKVFADRQEQDTWVAREIIKNIKEEELRADDIIVINPDPITTREAVGAIRKILADNGIDSHVAGVDSSPDVFFESSKDSVTFTGIYRAKGNEAAMVYVINAQDCSGNESFLQNGSIAKLRNRLFTAITRSKAWVRLVGFGAKMESIKQEVDEVINHNYQLDFVYPTAEQRRTMNIVNRDKSQADLEAIKRGRMSLNEIVEGLQTGAFYIEDLPEATLNDLRSLLNLGDKK